MTDASCQNTISDSWREVGCSVPSVWCVPLRAVHVARVAARTERQKPRECWEIVIGDQKVKILAWLNPNTVQLELHVCYSPG